MVPKDILKDLENLLEYNYGDEEKDYEECKENGIDTDGHVFEVIFRLDTWLSAQYQEHKDQLEDEQKAG